jgi:hypothetical protein
MGSRAWFLEENLPTSCACRYKWLCRSAARTAYVVYQVHGVADECVVEEDRAQVEPKQPTQHMLGPAASLILATLLRSLHTGVPTLHVQLMISSPIKTTQTPAL